MGSSLLCQRLPGNSHLLDFRGKRRQCSRFEAMLTGRRINEILLMDF